MTFYIILFTICIIAFILNEKLKDGKGKRIFEISTLLLLCIISGTRFELGGTDYGVYRAVYNMTPLIYEGNILDSSFTGITEEVGYVVFNSIVKTMGFSFYGFTLIHSIIFYSCMYIGLKRYIKNFNFFIIIFLYKLFFYNTFISMRQSISIAIFFLIFRYIEERKPIKYFIGCMLAFAFHNSAFILFPIYFINRIKLSKQKFAIIYIIGLVFFILNITSILILNPQPILTMIFQNNARAMSNMDEYFSGFFDINILHTLEYYLIALLVYLNYNKLLELKNKKDGKYINSIINTFVVLIPIFTVFRSIAIVTRMKDYFLFTYPVLLYYIAKIKTKKYAILIYTTAIIISIYGCFRFMNNFDGGHFLNYKSYLTRDISIFDYNKNY